MNDVVAALLAGLSDENREWLSRQPMELQRQIAEDWEAGAETAPGVDAPLRGLGQDPDEYVSTLRLMSP
ncbi:hypothetical protein ACFPM3_23725 [Streptomyces coeruleoprunus]|uniref:Uncharacterized protein n=1 Tax=Streptomyces coeruleoprunus TaxID=285563 RepID=A0ABV9XID3_9ACTN